MAKKMFCCKRKAPLHTPLEPLVAKHRAEHIVRINAPTQDNTKRRKAIFTELLDDFQAGAAYTLRPGFEPLGAEQISVADPAWKPKTIRWRTGDRSLGTAVLVPRSTGRGR